MTYTLEPVHTLSDFIQERALGGLIRQWLMMGEAERNLSIQTFRQKCLQSQVESMEATLLQLAASYPSSAVRLELIRLYAGFIKEAVRTDPTTNQPVLLPF